MHHGVRTVKQKLSKNKQYDILASLFFFIFLLSLRFSLVFRRQRCNFDKNKYAERFNKDISHSLTDSFLMSLVACISNEYVCECVDMCLCVHTQKKKHQKNYNKKFIKNTNNNKNNNLDKQSNTAL